MKLWTKNSRHLWRTLKPSFFHGFPLYRAVKALHLQAIMTSHDKVAWLGVTVRLLIAQWCNIRKSSVFPLLNMHIIISSWQMLYFQCLIIRFYRFSRILPKRKKITWAYTSCRCLSEISGHAAGGRASLRTAYVSPRSSAEGRFTFLLAKRPSEAMREEKRLPFAG